MIRLSPTAIAAALIAVVGLALFGFSRHGGDAGAKLELLGGGFVFNYRTADHYYGLVVRPTGNLPEAGRLEVHFEEPGGTEEVTNQDLRRGQLQYVFQTGNLRGIVKDHPYHAIVVLREAVTGRELARLEKDFKTNVDQASLPDQPLVVGPGYQVNQ